MSGWRSAVGGWLLASACWSATVEARLRPEVALAAPHATLADIAELSGPAEAVAALGAVAIQDLSPTPVLIDERLVRARAARQTAGISLSIRGESRVRQPLRTYSVEELVRAASAVVVRSGEDTEVTLLRASGPLAVGDDGSEPRIEATTIDRGQVGDVPLRVRLLRGERELARALVVLRVRRFAHITILENDLRRGTVIGPGDVSLQRAELTQATQDGFRSLDEVVGRQPVRDLVAGQPLTPGSTEIPLDVRPGQAVAMVFRTGTVELSAPGEALAGGRSGEVVMVRRAADDRRVRCQVLAPGRVLVNF